jgi:hypothetical protein
MAPLGSVESTCTNWKTFKVLVRFFKFWNICVFNHHSKRCGWSHCIGRNYRAGFTSHSFKILRLEGLYITSLREFLSSINGSIVTEHSYTIPLQQVHDRAIMDVVIVSNLFTPSEQCKTINYCRMFLCVHSIADLTLAGRNHIDFSFLALDPLLLSSASTLIEPLRSTTNSIGIKIMAPCKSTLVQYSYWWVTSTTGKVVGSRSTTQEEMALLLWSRY